VDSSDGPLSAEDKAELRRKRLSLILEVAIVGAIVLAFILGCVWFIGVITPKH
jgi:hypothetical protein